MTGTRARHRAQLAMVSPQYPARVPRSALGMAAHEAPRDRRVEFAFVIAVLAALIGLAPLIHRENPRFTALGVAIILS